jgi:hypothetical protein
MVGAHHLDKNVRASSLLWAEHELGKVVQWMTVDRCAAMTSLIWADY